MHKSRRPSLTAVLLSCFVAEAAHAQLAFEEQPFLSIGISNLGRGLLHDMDGINGPDIVVGSDSLGGFTVAVWRNDGFGNFPVELLAQTLACGDSADVAPGDWDGDGLTDILALDKHNTTSRICFVRQVSFGVWADHSSAAIIGDRARIEACDVDGDGRVDVVIGNPDAGQVEVYLNDGAGDISSIVGVPYAAPDVTAFACCDVNGDGRPDLATVGGDGLLRLRLNTGGGAFGAPTLHFMGGGPSAIACSDLDGDGLPDLAVTRQDDDSVVVYLSDGLGGFTIVSAIPAGTTPTEITCGDLDCDGDVDLAVTSYPAGDFRGILNDGTGTGWTLTPIVGGAGSSTTVGMFTGEIDGEPGIDVVQMFDAGVGVAIRYYNIGATCGDCVPAPPDLVAWYPGGDLCVPLDVMDNHDGAIVGSPFCPIAKVGGGALGFDDAPTPTYVSIDDDCELDPGDGDFSMNAWVRTNASGQQPIATKGGAPGYEFGLFNGQVRFVICDTGPCWMTAGSTLIDDGDWHHVAFTIDRGASTIIRVWVDGHLENTTLAPLGTVTSGQDLLLGAWPSPAPSVFLDGAIDELQIVARAMSTAEIQAIHRVGIPGQCADALCAPTGACDEPLESAEITAGITDDFVLPAEPATPGAVLAASCPGSVDFDIAPVAGSVCHTFTDVPITVIGATLEVRLKASLAASCDDTINLQATGGAPAFLWSRRIGAPTLGCGGDAGLLDCTWDPLDAWTFCFDLGALPESGGSTSSIIDDMKSTGRLDVRVEDHTAVDFLRLRLLLCPCSGDASGDGVVGVDDMVLVITSWGPCLDPCPPACAADFNDDCVVDVNDLVLVYTEWGPCGE